MIISLDLETVCNVADCKGYGDYKKCNHALEHHRNKVTVGAFYWEVNGEERSFIFRDLNEFIDFVLGLPTDFSLGGQNLKFDLKTLSTKLPNTVYKKLFDNYKWDSQIMALASTQKVSKDYLENYEEKRKEINKEHKVSHRKAGGYSLKTLAPYFLGVKPFWEVDDKDDDEYVIKDAKYAYKLKKYFDEFLKVDGTLDFFNEKLMPWQKFLLKMELRGFWIDLEAMDKLESSLQEQYDEKLSQLKETWEDGIKAWEAKERQNLILEQRDKLDKAVQKMRLTKAWAKMSEEKRSLKFDKVVGKQLNIIDKKLEEMESFNFNSNDQMLWLLTEQLGYECRDDTGKPSVGKDAKERLILEGKEDIALLDEIDKLNKLLTSYFPSYRQKHHEGVLYGSFNLSGTRTGRLSSSNPNLQNIHPIIRSFLKPRKGYKFIVRDMSGIEPNLIGFFTEDPELCNICVNGRNFHNVATKILLSHVTCDETEVKEKYKAERNLAKQLDLSAFYGTGKNGFVRTAKKHRFNINVEEAAHMLGRYKSKFKQVFEFKKNLDTLLEAGQVVTGILGRKFVIEDPTEVYMKSLNTLVQGSASDLVVDSACNGYNEAVKKYDVHPIALVHDELIFEVKEDQAEEVDKIINHHMTKYELPTVHGTIKLKTDGGVSDEWTH